MHQARVKLQQKGSAHLQQHNAHMGTACYFAVTACSPEVVTLAVADAIAVATALEIAVAAA